MNIKPRLTHSLGPLSVLYLWPILGPCHSVAKRKYLICIWRLLWRLSRCPAAGSLALSAAAGLTGLLLSLHIYLRSQTQIGFMSFLELLSGRWTTSALLWSSSHCSVLWGLACLETNKPYPVHTSTSGKRSPREEVAVVKDLFLSKLEWFS